MSKIQIITKAVVTAIGIYAVFLILSQIIKIYPVIFFESYYLLKYSLFMAGMVLMIILAVENVIFKNDWLVNRIVPSGQSQIPTNQASVLLIRSMRIAFVVTGLFLMPNALEFLYTFIKTVQLHNSMRFISEVFNGVFRAGRGFYWKIFVQIISLILIVIDIYLLTGARHCVKWHNTRFIKKQSQTLKEVTVD